MNQGTKKQLIDGALLVFLWGIWGYNWLVTKAGMAYASPFGLAAIRAMVAAATLGLILWARKQSFTPPPWRYTLLIGITQTAAFTGLMNMALQTGGAGKVSVLCYTMPFWTLVFARVFLGEHIRGRQWAGIALAFAGLFLILEPWQLSASSLSSWLALASGISWAISAILIKKLAKRHATSPLSLTFWQMVWAIPLLMALWALMDAQPVVWQWPLLWILVYVGCLAGGAGWWLWSILLSRLSAGAASLNILVLPCVSLMAAWIHTGEQPSPAEGGGMILIVVALGMLTLVNRTKRI